jgi:diaminopimelate epimerase
LVGCDQLIFINKDENYDASIEFYNSDGGISGACGNGTRCVAELLGKEKNKDTVTLTTLSGHLKSHILGEKLVSTEIGLGRTKWNEIPLSEELETKNLNIKIVDLNNNEFFGGTAVNVGNPHIIFFVEDNEQFEIEKIGPEIENHKLFPEKCNVTIATIINKELIKVKVWERGAGLTKACGTAACATAYAAKQAGLASDKVDIEFSTGKLTISIDENNSIHMKGPVSDIKKINIEI